MTDQLGAGLANGWTTTTASSTVADCAVADYSRDVNAQLPVMRPDLHRDDADLTGHRFTELTPDREPVRDAA